MARRVLLDTGFVVAIINEADPDHAACVAVWRDLRAQLFSVEGVLVEGAHLLRKSRNGAAAATRLVYASGTTLVPLTEERAARALALMSKYSDVPMDFVDALLVTVGEDYAAREVLTLDRGGFETYRIGGKGRFRLLPERR